LAVELADEVGLTLAGFVRGASMVVYAGNRRVRAEVPVSGAVPTEEVPA